LAEANRNELNLPVLKSGFHSLPLHLWDEDLMKNKGALAKK